VALILVVDDEYTIALTLAEVLRWNGYQVATAANGQLALEAMRSARPALVLLDWMMPVLDGLQVLAALRADAELADIPVVLMSAAPEAMIPQTARWDAFLRKPFREPALTAVLATLLG
jgi:CheY-like chemotaxis protein